MVEPSDLRKSAICYKNILCGKIHSRIHLAGVVSVIFIVYIARKPTSVRYVVVENKERMSHVSRIVVTNGALSTRRRSMVLCIVILTLNITILVCNGGQYVLQGVRRVLPIRRALSIQPT